MPLVYTDEEKKCFELLKTLNECHIEHPYGRYLGFCTSLGEQYQRCYKEAFKMKALEHSKKAEMKNAEIRSRVNNSN